MNCEWRMVTLRQRSHSERPHIRQVSDLMSATVQDVRKVENIWFNVGTASTLNSQITNDSEDIVQDMAGNSGPPNNVRCRCSQPDFPE